MKMELIERIRTQLVNSNLRLVASIARKFSSSYGDVDDFSSDGCMILLGAIDRFDYSRKFRFSTYATHSIQRHFFRAWKIRQRRKERFPNAASEILSELPQQVEQSPVCDDPEMVVGRLLSQAESLLDEREHQILLERFGLGGRNKEGRTLREIASDLGISKERVRQLQMKALEKLRQILDPEYLNQDCLPELC
jgi:RNA polymerase sigma factor (sigma-70 family)